MGLSHYGELNFAMTGKGLVELEDAIRRHLDSETLDETAAGELTNLANECQSRIQHITAMRDPPKKVSDVPPEVRGFLTIDEAYEEAVRLGIIKPEAN